MAEAVKDNTGTIIKWEGIFTDVHAEKAFTHELEIQVAERTKDIIRVNQILRESEQIKHLMVDEVQS